MMLEFGKPYVLTFELNIAGTAQRPSVVRAVFSSGDTFMGFNCKQLNEKQYELIANVPIGIFNAGNVLFTIEALIGTQVFSIYKKPVEASSSLTAVQPAPEVPAVNQDVPSALPKLEPDLTASKEVQGMATSKPQEVEVEIEVGDKKVEIEVEPDGDIEIEKEEKKDITYNSGHVSSPKKVDLTIEAYIAPKDLMKSLAEAADQVPVKMKKTASKQLSKRKPTDSFSIKKTKLVLL